MSQETTEQMPQEEPSLTTTETTAAEEVNPIEVAAELTTPPKPQPKRISQGGDLDPQGILSPETVSVKQRFLYARRMQEMRERERLNQVKLDPQQTIRTARRSIYQTDDAEVHSPASRAFSDKLLDGVSSDKVWADTVRKMKQHQEERSLEMKGSTVAYSQELQQNRVVTQRISQWEALFIQTDTTAEELAQSWRIVKEYFQLISAADKASKRAASGEEYEENEQDEEEDAMTLDDLSAGDAFRGRPGETDKFTLGSTRVYAARTFGEETESFLAKTFPNKAKYFGLVSGVYSDKSYKPPLRVVSMALRGESGAFYIAISIKPLLGYEDDANLLGTRKIVVCSPLGSASAREKERNTLFEVSFNMVFTSAACDRRDRHSEHGSGNGEKTVCDGESVENKTSGEAECTEDDLLAMDVHDCNSLTAFDTLAQAASQRRSLGKGELVLTSEYRSSIATANVSPYVERESESEEETEKEEDEDNALAAAALSLSVSPSVGDAVERETESVVDSLCALTENNTPGSVFSTQLGDTTADAAAETERETERETMARNYDLFVTHTPLGETLRFEDKNVVGFSLPVRESEKESERERESLVDSLQSTRQYLVIGCAQQGLKNVLVSATSLKAMHVSSQSTVSQDQVYEWVRGVSANGWIAKFPTSASVGRYQRRYFVLQDNTLTYYKSKPTQEEFFCTHDYKSNMTFDRDEEDELQDRKHGFTMGGYYLGGKALLITEETKLELCLTFLQPTLKITTPSTNQTLLLRMKRGTDKDKYWMNALKRTIDMQARKRSTASSTIKTLWLHENPTYRLVALDVKTLSPHNAIKAALFLCDLPAHGRRLELESGPRYILDLDHNEHKLQLELFTQDGLFFHTPRLRAVKVLNEHTVVVSGEQGFIAVGRVLDHATNAKKMILTPCLLPSGAERESVACLAAEKTILVTGNSARTLCVWNVSLSNSSGSAQSCVLCGTLDLSVVDVCGGVFADERIVAVSFLRPGDASLVVVSTTKRILCLTLSLTAADTADETQNNTNNTEIFTHFAELDRVQDVDTQNALFSLAYYESLVQPAPLSSSAAARGHAALAKSMVTAQKIEKRFSFWKAVSLNDAEKTKKNNNKKGEVATVEWVATRADLDEEKLLSLLRDAQPIPHA